MTIGALHAVPPLVDSTYATSVWDPDDSAHATCRSVPDRAKLGKLLVRKVPPGSGLGMSESTASCLVVKLVPPLVDFEYVMWSPLLSNDSCTTLTPPEESIRTTEPVPVTVAFTGLGVDHVAPALIVLEKTTTGVPDLNSDHVT